MSIPSLIAEDHSHAYGFWKELGIEGAVCIHVDAHLDVMDRGFTPEVLERLKACPGREGLEELSPPPYLPWGGMHCGNYLYPALHEGIVSRLIWVVPEPLVGGKPLLDFARDELLNWVDMDIVEFQSLHMEGQRVEGTLCGHPFTLCLADQLPELDPGEKVLLDIDVDYYQDSDDQIWQSPSALQKLLNLPKYDVLTVAVSVDGGYTALEHRYLAEVTELVFTADQGDLWEPRLQAFFEADRARGENPDAYDNLGRPGDPPWLVATLVLKVGLAVGLPVLLASQGPAAIDARFTATAFNEAMVQARHQRLEQALALFNDEDEQLFMRAILALKGGRPEISEAAWVQFLDRVSLGPTETAHALYLLGQACLQQDRLAEALTHLNRAATLDPGSFQYQLFAGLAYQLTGDLKKAAKCWRKALSDHAHKVSCVELHLELARLYRDMGRAALAEAEIQRLRQKDTTGTFKLMISMEQIRSAQPPGSKDSALWRQAINLVGVHS